MAVVLAAVSHTIGGGVAPSFVVLLAAAAISWPIATLLVGRRPSLLGQAAAVAAAQIALHSLFALIGAMQPAGAGAHVHDAAGAAAYLDAHPMSVIAPSTSMLAAHLVAALAALVLVRHGEGAVAEIRSWIVAVLRERVGRIPAPALPRVVVVRSIAVPSAPVTGPTTLRGPPVLSR